MRACRVGVHAALRPHHPAALSSSAAGLERQVPRHGGRAQSAETHPRDLCVRQAVRSWTTACQWHTRVHGALWSMQRRDRAQARALRSCRRRRCELATPPQRACRTMQVSLQPVSAVRAQLQGGLSRSRPVSSMHSAVQSALPAFSLLSSLQPSLYGLCFSVWLGSHVR